MHYLLIGSLSHFFSYSCTTARYAHSRCSVFFLARWELVLSRRLRISYMYIFTHLHIYTYVYTFPCIALMDRLTGSSCFSCSFLCTTARFTPLRFSVFSVAWWVLFSSRRLQGSSPACVSSVSASKKEGARHSQVIDLYIYTSIYTYVHIYLCFYVCIYVSMYLSNYVYLCLSIYSSIYVSLRLSICPSIYLSVAWWVLFSLRRLQVSSPACVISASASNKQGAMNQEEHCLYSRVYTHTHTHTYIYICIYIYIHIYIYIYVYNHMWVLCLSRRLRGWSPACANSESASSKEGARNKERHWRYLCIDIYILL